MLMMMNLMPEHQGRDLKLNNDRLAPYGENDMFNTGVVLFDIDAIRSESGMVDNIANHMDFGCDQQSLNYHLKGRVRYLDPVWNAMPGTFHLCHWLLKAMTEDETIYKHLCPPHHPLRRHCQAMARLRPAGAVPRRQRRAAIRVPESRLGASLRAARTLQLVNK